MAKIKTNITAWKKMGNPDNISRTNDSILCDTFWTDYTDYNIEYVNRCLRNLQCWQLDGQSSVNSKTYLQKDTFNELISFNIIV